MKRLWIAIAIIGIAIFLCVGEQLYVKSFCDEMNIIVSSAQNDPGKENIQKIKKYWDKKNDILYSICQHDMLDEMSISINQLISTDDEEEIKSALIDIKAQNYTFYENQRVTFSNIS